MFGHIVGRKVAVWRCGYMFGHTRCDNCGHVYMTTLFWLYDWLYGRVSLYTYNYERIVYNYIERGAFNKVWLYIYNK